MSQYLEIQDSISILLNSQYIFWPSLVYICVDLNLQFAYAKYADCTN